MKKVLIIFGGNSYEHEISCLSATNILKNINKKKFNVKVIGISKKNDWYFVNECNLDKNWENLPKEKISNIIETLKTFDVIFPAMHGNYGEDGRTQSFFELFNINYLGSNSTASKICMNKYLTKLVCEKNNIPQLPYTLIKKGNIIPKNIKFPLIVKPANGGSSIGINIAHSKKELKKCISDAFKYDDEIVLEKFIRCRELECAVIGKDKLLISTVGEIKSCNEFYDYEAKYQKESKLIIPAKIDEKVIKDIKMLSKKIFKALNLKDFARIDFLYDEINNKLYFNEVNTIPGFTDKSMFPLLFKNQTLDFSKLISKIIER